MEISEIRQLCIDSLSAVPGVIKLHKPSLDLDKSCSDAEECEVILQDVINITSVDNSHSVQIAITVLDGVSVKFIVTQLFKQIDFALRKKKQKLNSLTVIVKGVQ
ncbi:hypothetical protein [Mycoplasma seminis]|uniref:Asp23/Gls24 family envelope stress response protein n=1 Tax=Mycoplasma seminis TaxID=512749 RepID=A0ABY9HAT3_9MOLU|nr:hypothetical protein [Mycoplasma seminis]WLP85366.1 hypothetical protein Q8852_03535 [Mycoplasma seminis]